jgi:hypothetical protein
MYKRFPNGRLPSAGQPSIPFHPLVHQYRLHTIMADERSSKLLITFVAFLVLLNYPILGIVDKPLLCLGLPLLYFYLFFVWLTLIVADRFDCFAEA